MLFVDVAITKKATNHIKGIFGNTKKTIIDNMCMGLIQHVKIKTIWYSNEDGHIVSAKV